MKYKIGDKVRIKLLVQIIEEFGTDGEGGAICQSDFPKNMEKDLNSRVPSRILTIMDITKSYYIVKEMGWSWSDDMIECLAKEYVAPVSIRNRFEIMDLD